MKKAILCILICLLIILTTVVPASAATLSEKIAHSLRMGEILYVGGSGPNNYTKIQDRHFQEVINLLTYSLIKLF